MLTEQELERIWSLSESNIKQPRFSDIVHNDECLFSFATPFTDGGLYVNLSTWKGVGPDFLNDDLDAAPNGTGIYVWMRHEARPIDPTTCKDQVEKLAIGVPGGFQTATTETIKNHSVIVHDGDLFIKREFQLDDPDLPEPIATVAKAVGEHKGAFEQRQLQSWEAIDERPVSKYAHSLIQEAASEDRKSLLADPGRWRCELSGDTANLWLNLSDGFIGGGRKNFDGSGGSNGAIDHFNQLKAEESKMYPLAVKLGTISADGTADVYSYEEDCMVTDPLLGQHLAHWGIDPLRLSKSDKTMAELELELNKDFAFDKIVESGEQLDPVLGTPGMRNLGNTCYINSVMQLVGCVPEIRDRYTDKDAVVRRMLGRDFLKSGEHHAPTRTLFELAKCINGLSGDSCLSMNSFREQIAWGHSEFSSNRQQDSVEFFLHLLKELTKAERAAMTENLTEGLFAIEIEEKLTCEEKVRYSHRTEYVLPVQVTRDDNGVQNEKVKRSKFTVDFQNCLETTFSNQTIDGFKSPISGQVVAATKSSGIASMPQYLLISVNRYYFTESFEPAKLDCEVLMPERFSLEPFRSRGVQPGEEVLPESSIDQDVDMEIVNQLTMMGFLENVVRQACVATKNTGPEAALQWCLENPNGSGFLEAVNQDSILSLTGMGFTEKQATAALKATEGNPDRAADWLLSRADQLDTMESSSNKKINLDGLGDYELMGIVSHLGSSTTVGHYVAHIRVNGEWFIFNDELVAKSRKPPINFGYLYLYRRI